MNPRHDVDPAALFRAVIEISRGPEEAGRVIEESTALYNSEIRARLGT